MHSGASASRLARARRGANSLILLIVFFATGGGAKFALEPPPRSTRQNPNRQRKYLAKVTPGVTLLERFRGRSPDTPEANPEGKALAANDL